MHLCSDADKDQDAQCWRERAPPAPGGENVGWGHSWCHSDCSRGCVQLLMAAVGGCSQCVSQPHTLLWGCNVMFSFMPRNHSRGCVIEICCWQSQLARGAPPPVSTSESRAACPVGFTMCSSLLLIKPLHKSFLASFLGNAELETSAAFMCMKQILKTNVRKCFADTYS